jgi:hypothetical protein
VTPSTTFAAFKSHFDGEKLSATASRPELASPSVAWTGRCLRSEIASGLASIGAGSLVPLRMWAVALVLFLTTTQGGSWNLPGSASAEEGQA